MNESATQLEIERRKCGRRVCRHRPPLSAADVRRAHRPGARRPGARAGDRQRPRRPCVSVHRRPRRRQDLGRADPGQGAQLRDGPDADALQRVRRLPQRGHGRRRRRARDRRRSNRGIDEIRQLRQNVAVRPSRARFKIYIIDEVHMLTKEAFNALLKTLEEPPEHVKFIFATTEANKIPITILSRCQRFDFAGIDMRRDPNAARADRGGRRRRGRARGAADPGQPGGRVDARQPVAARAVALGRPTSGSRRPRCTRCLGTAPAERLSGLVQPPGRTATRRRRWPSSMRRSPAASKSASCSISCSVTSAT